MPTGHSVNYFINVNRDRRHLLFCQCYKSHHQQLREYKFVWDKWTMIYMINKIRNDLPAICQISWYTLGNRLKSCLLKSKCYTGIYSSNSVNSLKINLFTLRSLSFSLIRIVLSDKRQALQLVTATQAINSPWLSHPHDSPGTFSLRFQPDGFFPVWKYSSIKKHNGMQK